MEKETAAPEVLRIDPTDWFAGMKNPCLQLLVYGGGIAKASVSTTYKGVTVERTVRLDSPNYLVVYLNLAGAVAGEMPLCFTADGLSVTVNYRLRERMKDSDKRKGFTNADVLYLVMPDRFACGNPKKHIPDHIRPFTINRRQPSLRHGGDLQGIIDHLSYLQDLGVTALWLTPVLENNTPDEGQFSAYHGYAITDFYHIDPRLGSDKDYLRLVKEAHRHGLKVIMDFVFNHCGLYHPWLNDMPAKDWLNNPDYGSRYVQTNYKLTPVLDSYASDVDRRQTVEGWFVKSMPDLNMRNRHLARYLTQCTLWWIETAGIDGIRMDTYPYSDAAAMAAWAGEINNEYPHFNIVGETWVTEPAYTAAWQSGSRLSAYDTNLKSVMDFALYDRMSKAKNEETDEWWAGLNRIYNTLAYDYLYPAPENVLAFIENHDTDRFLGDGHDTAALKQALALILTIKRTPQLYYGTEILMNGTCAVTDGNVRRDFPGGFPEDERSAFTAAGRTADENRMYNWLRRILHWRQGNEAVISGKQIQFIPQNGIYVVARLCHSRTVMTVINGRNRPASLQVSHYAEVIGNAAQATNILTGRKIRLDRNVRLHTRQTIILDFNR